MEIVPTIFCTLDNETDLIIKEVFDLIPSEIYEFHRHIRSTESNQELNDIIKNTITYLQTLRSNNLHSPRHISTSVFNCNLFILFRNIEGEKIDDFSKRFKEKFNEVVKGGSYNEILFNLSEQDISYLPQNYYQVCNQDSHGTRIDDEKLAEKIKYFFLFFLTSDLYDSEKIEFTNNAFCIYPIAAHKYFKSIAIEVDGLPIFSLKEYYFESLKEKYLRELLIKQKELDDEGVLNKIKLISSLEVENFKSPDKPPNPLKLSFFSTKKVRKENIESAIKQIPRDFDDYEKKCNKKAKEQRLNLEKEVKSKKPDEVRSILYEIVSSSKSITELLKLIDKLLDKNGKIYQLLIEKENEIKWAQIFHSTKKQFASNHPNWLIFSILGGLFILPELIDYLLYFPTEYMIKWNVLLGLIWSGYILFSVFDLRRVKNSFNEFYFKNLQSIENYFSKSFSAFIKFLEFHIVKMFLRGLTKKNESLIHNQAFLMAYYITSFKSAPNYEEIKEIYKDHVKSRGTYSDLFITRINEEIITILNNKKDFTESLKNIYELNDQYKKIEELMNLIENANYKTRLEILTEKLKSELDKLNLSKDNYEKLNNTILKEIEESNFNFDSSVFIEKINLNQLESKINEFISHQNFDNLLSKIKQQLDFSPKELIEKLLNKDYQMYYLSPSQDRIDEKKMIFSPDLLRREDITEYKNELKVICGYLKIGDFKVNNSEEAKS